MDEKSPRWRSIAESGFAWEREALGFLRRGLPDGSPYQIWSNFEFIAGDGSINEVDALVLAPRGFFLIEIKSRPGTITGDAGTWTWVNNDGRSRTVDNPLLLANRKAKKLASLLHKTNASKGVRVPFIQAVIFLSDPGIRFEVSDNGRQHVFMRQDAGEMRPGIIKALTHYDLQGAQAGRLRLVDSATERAMVRAIQKAGIRKSQTVRRVGDYLLEDVLHEGPGFQDWTARNVSLERIRRRVRVYLIEPGARSEERGTIRRAALREAEILEGIEHPGILPARDFTEHELGPVVMFDYVPGSLRLDQFLSQKANALSLDQRLSFIRQIAEGAFPFSCRLQFLIPSGVGHPRHLRLQTLAQVGLPVS